jgi:hypothetical protein
MSVSKVFDDLDPVLDDKGGLKNSDAAIEELIRYRHDADALFSKINTVQRTVKIPCSPSSPFPFCKESKKRNYRPKNRHS